MDFRPEFPAAELDRLRVHCRNAMILLDLQNCDAGYCPTRWQRDRLPGGRMPTRCEVIFDGVDTDVWRRQEGLPRRLGDREMPARRGSSPTSRAASSRCAASTSS